MEILDFIGIYFLSTKFTKEHEFLLAFRENSCPSWMIFLFPIMSIISFQTSCLSCSPHSEQTRSCREMMPSQCVQVHFSFSSRRCCFAPTVFSQTALSIRLT